MLDKIRNRIETELSRYLASLERDYKLKTISPLLFKSIREFSQRPGKRIRPSLFVIGYLGFSSKEAPGLYKSAVSIELLHDFMLIHDDIIDKSPTRRGKPSMHTLLGLAISKNRDSKFSGQDLAIVAGDAMFAMAINVFLSIKAKPRNKEKALRRLTEAALYTASGEFIELLCGAKDIASITQEEIFRIYDLKTANYTFSSPLTIGASLAGAPEKQIKQLFKYGTYLGRAFQIKDDILGIFGEVNKTGKSNLTDLNEAKKTILIWKAYQNSPASVRKEIQSILRRQKITQTDLFKIRGIIKRSGSLDYACRQINILIAASEQLLNSSRIRPRYKIFLKQYAQNILNT